MKLKEFISIVTDRSDSMGRLGRVPLDMTRDDLAELRAECSYLGWNPIPATSMPAMGETFDFGPARITLVGEKATVNVAGTVDERFAEDLANKGSEAATNPGATPTVWERIARKIDEAIEDNQPDLAEQWIAVAERLGKRKGGRLQMAEKIGLA